MIFFVLIGFWICFVFFTAFILVYFVCSRIEKKEVGIQTDKSCIQRVVIHPNDEIEITSLDYEETSEQKN